MADKVSNVYAVAGAKAGVGRTTTSVNLGAALSAAGYEPVVVEADLRMATLVDSLDVDIDLTAAPTLHDVLAGDAPVEAATYTTADGLDVVPSGVGLERFDGVDLDDLPTAFETLQGDDEPPAPSVATTHRSAETPPQRPDGGRIVEDGTEPSTDPEPAAPRSVARKVLSALGL
jgi:hypothetical protein